MTQRPPIPLDAYRLPRSLLRDGWWLVEPREALVIPFPTPDRRAARPQRPSGTDKEKKS